MKIILKTILKYYLKYLAKISLFINKPFIIAVAGSTNKYFTRQYIKKELEKEGFKVRTSKKNFNTEIGLPLAILDLPSGYNSYKKWWAIIKEAPKALFFNKIPPVLILEFGVSDPGDMSYLLSIVKPHMAIITEITQRYLEGFADIDNLFEEYKILLSNLNQKGCCILNYDNSKIKSISKKCKSKKIFFGFSDNLKWQIVKCQKHDNGQQVIIKHKDVIKKYYLPRFGIHHAYAFLISLIVKIYVIKELSPKNKKTRL